jgi:thermitase
MQTVDLAAPGADILSTMPGNKYGKLSGTSMATPLVAGLVGLLKSQDASLTPSQIRSILQSSGAKVDIKTACNCRIDAEASTRVVSSKALTVIPAAASLGIGANLQFGVYGGNGPYTYKSSDPDVASIDASGKLTTIKEGDVTVSVEDADGNKASSLGILVGRETPPDEGGSGDCPLGEPMLCAIICQIMPTAPWCEGGGGGDDDEGGMPGWPDLPEFPGMSHR